MEEHKVKRIIDAVNGLSDAIFSGAQHLGLSNASTRMGALEVLSLEIKNGSERIAEALNSIAIAIRYKENAGEE
jgi:hypothetical protein